MSQAWLKASSFSATIFERDMIGLGHCRASGFNGAARISLALRKVGALLLGVGAFPMPVFI
jgi:hypothetical protein